MGAQNKPSVGTTHVVYLLSAPNLRTKRVELDNISSEHLIVSMRLLPYQGIHHSPNMTSAERKQTVLVQCHEAENPFSTLTHNASLILKLIYPGATSSPPVNHIISVTHQHHLPKMDTNSTPNTQKQPRTQFMKFMNKMEKAQELRQKLTAGMDGVEVSLNAGVSVKKPRFRFEEKIKKSIQNCPSRRVSNFPKLTHHRFPTRHVKTQASLVPLRNEDTTSAQTLASSRKLDVDIEALLNTALAEPQHKPPIACDAPTQTATPGLLVKLKLPKGVTHDRERRMQRESVLGPHKGDARIVLSRIKDAETTAPVNYQNERPLKPSFILKLKLPDGVTYDREKGIQRSLPAAQQDDTADAPAVRAYEVGKQVAFAPQKTQIATPSLIVKLKLPPSVIYDKVKGIQRPSQAFMIPISGPAWASTRILKVLPKAKPAQSLVVNPKLPPAITYDEQIGVLHSSQAIKSPIETLAAGSIDNGRQLMSNQTKTTPAQSLVVKLKLPPGLTYDKEHGIQRFPSSNTTTMPDIQKSPSILSKTACRATFDDSDEEDSVSSLSDDSDGLNNHKEIFKRHGGRTGSTNSMSNRSLPPRQKKRKLGKGNDEHAGDSPDDTSDEEKEFRRGFDRMVEKNNMLRAQDHLKDKELESSLARIIANRDAVLATADLSPMTSSRQKPSQGNKKRKRTIRSKQTGAVDENVDSKDS